MRISDFTTDRDLLDLFDVYQKLNDALIIGIAEDDDNSIVFRTYPNIARMTSSGISIRSSFLRYVFVYHTDEYKEVTKTSKFNDIWFLSFHGDDYEPYCAVWVANDSHERISFASGDTRKRYFSSESDVIALRKVMAEHVSILLMLKAMFYDEYRKTFKIP